MKINIKILVGISGSGKTNWSKRYVFENRNVKRINRDDLREMFDSYRESNGNENFARIARLEMVKLCINLNRHIIIDDTNCISDKLIDLINNIKFIADNLQRDVEIEIIDFDIDLETCLSRNKNRDRSLEDKIIYFMKKSKDQINFESLPVDKYTKIKD